MFISGEWNTAYKLWFGSWKQFRVTNYQFIMKINEVGKN